MIYIHLRFFNQVDENKKGWLTGTDAMIALKGVNSKLTETAEVYLYRVSVLMISVSLLHGHRIGGGAWYL